MSHLKSLLTTLAALAAIIVMTWAMIEFTGSEGWPEDAKTERPSGQ